MNLCSKRFVVMGGGGHAAVIIDTLTSAGAEVVGCVGPNPPTFDTNFCRYLGDDVVLSELASDIALAIGVGALVETRLRRKLYNLAQETGRELPAIVHPRSVVSRHAVLSAGAQILAGAVVNSYARIGANVLVNSGAIIEHHSEISDHASIAPGAIICGGVRLGEGAVICAGAVVRETIRIGHAAVLGAGGVAIDDIADGVTAVGVPARPAR